MSVKIKAGTCFVLPVTIEDAHFSDIEAIEFLFKQTEDGETVKTAHWVRDGESTDAEQRGNENVILILFSRDDTYLFRQNEMFFLDTRIHYSGAITNPYTPIVQLRMNRTLFAQGEEVGVNV